MRICIFEAEILIEPGVKEYVSLALNFMTFGNTSQKLWPNVLFFVRNWVVREDKKKSLFPKIKI